MSQLELLSVLLPFALVGLGYVIGHIREQNHIKSLDRREAALELATLVGNPSSGHLLPRRDPHVKVSARRRIERRRTGNLCSLMIVGPWRLVMRVQPQPV